MYMLSIGERELASGGWSGGRRVAELVKV